MIRRLGPGDIAALRGVNQLFATEFDDASSYAGAPPSDAYLARWLARDTNVALVAERAGVTEGALVAYELTKFEQERSEFYIYDLAVRQDRRRRGLATALIGHLQQLAATCGGWAIFVQADYVDPPAIALYEKLGVREAVLHFDLPVTPPLLRTPPARPPA